MDTLYETISPEVTREARLASARWNGFVEADDVEQELWIYILESPSVQKYLYEGNAPQVKSALKLKAESICSQAQITYEYYSGQYTYRPSEVRELLTTYFGSDVNKVSAEVLNLAYSELSQTMIQNILGGYITPDENVDLYEALEVLEVVNNKYHSALLDQFYYGNTVLHRSEQDRRERAVDKLTEIMNRKRTQRNRDRHQGPGTKPESTTNQEEV